MKRIEGRLPSTDRVKAVQDYLTSCGMPLESILSAHDAGDLSGMVARVEGYYGRFIGIEVTVRDAVQNIVLANLYSVTLIDERDGAISGKREYITEEKASRAAFRDSDAGFVSVVAWRGRIVAVYVACERLTIAEIEATPRDER